MSTFTIVRSPLKYRIWKRINEVSQKKLLKFQDLMIDVTNILVPTPSSMIIKFTVVNTGKRYELMLQGKYAEIYKETQDGEPIKPERVNAEIVIRSNMHCAFEIN